MLRIAGVNIAPNKHIIIGLTGIYGIGRTRAKSLCKEANLDPTTKGKDVTDDQAETLRRLVAKFVVEGDLRREIHMHIKRLMDIGSYRVFVISEACLCEASARAPMLERVKAASAR